MKEKGIDYPGQIVILEVCNPQRAKSVLEIDIKAGYLLPCKMAVYVKDGVTQIGAARPSKLIALMGNERLNRIGEEVDRDLMAAMGRAR